MNAIEIKNVTKTYKDFCLDNITLNLPSGCVLGLVGENGAGKSTTIELLMNATSKESGNITVLGVDNEAKEFINVKEDIGVVLDEAYFPEVLTALEVGKIMIKTYKRWDQKQYMKLIQYFRLPEKKMFKDYSKGMKMKLAIAVALAHDPKLLVLDEATSGLDPMAREEIMEIFNEFTRQENHSILISSHIISDLEKVCDYIALIHEGKLLFCKEKDQLKDEYRKLSVTKKEYEKIPQEAIVGTRENSYGVEVLIKQSLMKNQPEAEIVTLEEIILFLVKGGERTWQD